MRITQLAVLFSLLVCPLMTPADELEGSALQELLGSARMDLQWQDAELRGPGSEWLLRESRAARFVMLGEPHYTREAVRLFRALMTDLGGHGFNVLAVEMGPHTTARVEAEAAAGSEMLSAFESAHPDSAAFLGAERERNFLVAARRLGYRFWGLDQEFVLSGTRWLEWLAERPAAAAERERIEALLARAREGDRRFRESQDHSGVILTADIEADLEALSAAFADDAEASALIADLTVSRRIYGLWGEGQVYQSNFERVALMKRTFWNRWRGQARPPRVLFKFGSYHMGRGRSPVAQHDLGNLAHELAESMGERSFHIQVLGQQVPGAQGPVPLAARDPDLGPLAEVCAEGSWCVFDLSRLRENALRGEHSLLPPGLREKVYAFDALILAPELTSSR